MTWFTVNSCLFCAQRTITYIICSHILVKKWQRVWTTANMFECVCSLTFLSENLQENEQGELNAFAAGCCLCCSASLQTWLLKAWNLHGTKNRWLGIANFVAFKCYQHREMFMFFWTLWCHLITKPLEYVENNLLQWNDVPYGGWVLLRCSIWFKCKVQIMFQGCGNEHSKHIMYLLCVMWFSLDFLVLAKFWDNSII